MHERKIVKVDPFPHVNASAVVGAVRKLIALLDCGDDPRAEGQQRRQS
jgi:hypothetical protein